MIKSLGLAPGHLVVAGGAILTESTLVRVIGFVAPKARCSCIAELGALRVAISAQRRLVATLQFKIREDVIERLGIKLHDIGLAALVIGMTGLALRGHCARALAVKASF